MNNKSSSPDNNQTLMFKDNFRSIISRTNVKILPLHNTKAIKSSSDMMGSNLVKKFKKMLYVLQRSFIYVKISAEKCETSLPCLLIQAWEIFACLFHCLNHSVKADHMATVGEHGECVVCQGP